MQTQCLLIDLSWTRQLAGKQICKWLVLGGWLALSLSASGQCFQGARNFTVKADPNSTPRPTGVVIGDLDGDGKVDVVSANENIGNLSVLLSTSTGSYSQPTFLSAGTGTSAVAIGDLNGDGKADLATANNAGNDVSVLLGTGTGSFAAPAFFGVGNGPKSIVIGDVNKDGKADIVTANTSNGVSVLLGTGTGSFAAATNFAVGSGPSALAIGDMNGDGKVDLVTANSNSNNVSVLLGNGTGSLANAVNIGVGNYPTSVTIGDVNGDRKEDVVTTNGSSDNVSVLLGTGTNALASPIFFGVGSAPGSLVIGDVNGDGKADLVTANWGSNDISVLGTSSLAQANVVQPTCGAPNGSISFATTGLSGSYTLAYSLAGNAQTASITVSNNLFTLSGLPGGNYADFAITANGCPISLAGPITLNQSVNPTVSINPSSASLSCAMPSMQLMAVTSASNSLTWNTGQTTASLTVSVAGTYSVSVTNADGCTATATASVSGTPPPTQYTVTGGGTYCQGGTGPLINLSGSESGVSYQLQRDGSNVGTPVVGTGSALSFGNQTVAGTYSVLASTAVPACQQPMSGSAVVTITLLPDAPRLVTQSGYPYPANQTSLTISQQVGPVSLTALGCSGGVLMANGNATSSLTITTAMTGTQTYTATCTQNGCTSPAGSFQLTVVPPTLKVFSRDPDNGQLGNNTIKPYLVLQNAGSYPFPYSNITLRYWLTTEDNVGLIFQKNYIAIGQSNLNLRYVPITPTRQGATGYIEYSFSPSAGSLAANGDSGPLEIQVYQENYGTCFQGNDYSYINNSSFTLNPRITAYQNGTIFYGQEPNVTGSPRVAALAPELVTPLQIKVLGNPVVGQSAEVEISGVVGQAVQLKLVDLQGKLLYTQVLKQAAYMERVSLPLVSAQGILVLDVSTATQRQQVKLMRP